MAIYELENNPHDINRLHDALRRASLLTISNTNGILSTSDSVTMDGSDTLIINLATNDQAALDAFMIGFNALDVSATPVVANSTTVTASDGGTPLTTFDWHCVREGGTYESGTYTLGDPQNDNVFEFLDVGTYVFEVISGTKRGFVTVTVEEIV